MRTSIQKLTGVLLSAALLLTLLPITAAAAVPDTVYVGGIALSNGKWLAEGATTAGTSVLSDNYACYKNGVLMLKNFDYEGAADSAVIRSAGDLSIKLEGSSRLTHTGTDKLYHGISANGNVTFSAEAAAALELTADAGDGINATGTVTINSGTLTVSAGEDGIDAKSVTVNGGTLRSTAPWALYLSSGNGTLNVAASMAVYAGFKNEDGSVRLAFYDKEKVSSYGFILVTPAQPITVGGVRMQDGQWLAEGGSMATTFSKSDNYACYDGGVLTLKNFDYSGNPGSAAGYCGISADGPLFIRLQGSNSISVLPSVSNSSCGISAVLLGIDAAAGGTLDTDAQTGIAASESLTLYSGKVTTRGRSSAVETGSFYLAGGTLFADGGKYGIKASAIHAQRGILTAAATDTVALSVAAGALRCDAPLQVFSGDSIGYDPTATYVTVCQTAQSTRLAGATRYETAFLTANALKKELGISKFSAAIVTSGENFADALAGSYLAAKKNAPILLTKSGNSNIGDVMAYIRQNVASGGTVYALGGATIVSDKLLELRANGYRVVRLAGADRYETNLKILQEAGLSKDDPVLVCTGLDFPDSLSASALGLPILLVKSSLNNGQLSFLRQYTGGSYILVGGVGAVSTTVENQLLNDGAWVHRLAGADRYATSVMTAQFFYGSSVGLFEAPTSVTLTYSLNFPDGLCAGPLAYATGSPLLLTANGKDSAAAHYANTLGIRQGYALGGPSLISENSLDGILSLNPDYMG